jgi:hypothetical protein
MGKQQRIISKRNRPCVSRILARTVALLLAVATTGARAQSNTQAPPTAQPAPSPSTTPTLHVYTNLKQVPVLVLTSDHERMKPLDGSKFRVFLDSGRGFRPNYVHQEGDDPISLAILIDTTNPANELLPTLTQAIAALPPTYLRTEDRVSIYAVDCSLIRTAYNTPADSAVLQDAVQRAIAPWQIRRERRAPASCKQGLPLWDSMAQILEDLDHQSGRRVLLAITDGKDTTSKTSWNKVMKQAQIESVSIFGLLSPSATANQGGHETAEVFPVNSPFFVVQQDRLSQMCQQSGGVEIQATAQITLPRLKEFTQIVRERYILEFPRAPDEKVGVHSISVSYPITGLYIAMSGISVPPASEEELRGPKILPAAAARTPEEKSKALPPQ